MPTPNCEDLVTLAAVMVKGDAGTMDGFLRSVVAVVVLVDTDLACMAPLAETREAETMQLAAGLTMERASCAPSNVKVLKWKL